MYNKKTALQKKAKLNNEKGLLNILKEIFAFSL